MDSFVGFGDIIGQPSEKKQAALVEMLDQKDAEIARLRAENERLRRMVEFREQKIRDLQNCLNSFSKGEDND